MPGRERMMAMSNIDVNRETVPPAPEPLSELDLPDGIRIGAILHEGEFVQPGGNTVIRPRDSIIILALAERVRQVEQMFRVSLEYF